jgi:hypothetical protein
MAICSARIARGSEVSSPPNETQAILWAFASVPAGDVLAYNEPNATVAKEATYVRNCGKLSRVRNPCCRQR